jgi:stage V sporulation protein B
LVPEVSAANALKSRKRIDYIVNKCFKVTLLFAFLIMGIFLCFYEEIGLAFYKDAKVGSLLMIFAPLVPLMYLDMIVDSILKGLNQQMSSMKYNIADSAMRSLIIFVLVPIMGMKGYIIMLYFGTIFNALLSINRLIVVSKVRFRLVQWVVLPCIAITLACLFAKYFLNVGVFLSMTMVCVCYVVFLMLMGCITKRDWAWVIRVFYKK